MGGLLGGEDNIVSFVLNIAFYVVFIAYMFYGQRIQLLNMLREVEGGLNKLRVLKDEGRRVAVTSVKNLGKSEIDPTPRLDQFLEYFTIMPVDLDPSGIIPKLEHIVDIRDNRFKDEVRLMAPKADENQIDNLENLLDVALGLNYIYRVVRHFYLLGKKTKSIYLVMQVQMALPLIMQEAEALKYALKAFALGQPIGDGAGALVAGKMMLGRDTRVVAQDVVVSETDISGRKVFVLKAKGPGATVGKPGEAIEKIIEECGGKVSMVIMIDAMGKLEGEKSGETVEGIGAAIGGLGTDKFRIEEVTQKYKIPLNAIGIRESLQEAIAPMKKEIFESIDVAIARVRRLVVERTKEGNIVIIAGIGNTCGIGQ